MKIGLSYSRCVRDIVEGIVDINDVLVLITRTDFDPRDDEQWHSIFSGYTRGSIMNMNAEWRGLDDREEDLRQVSIELLNQGKLHQPRQFGSHPRRLPYIWLEAVLPTEELDTNPTLKAAWQKFQTLAQLSGVELDENC